MIWKQERWEFPQERNENKQNRRSSKRVDFVEEKAVEKVKTQLILHIYKGRINKVNFMPRRLYDRAEDWMVTCSVCHGSGAIGEGDLRKRCPNCDGAGKVSSTPQTRKLIRDSTWYGVIITGYLPKSLIVRISVYAWIFCVSVDMRERIRIGVRTGENKKASVNVWVWGLKFNLYNLFNLSILLWFGLKFNKKGHLCLFPKLFSVRSKKTSKITAITSNKCITRITTIVQKRIHIQFPYYV